MLRPHRRDRSGRRGSENAKRAEWGWRRGGVEWGSRLRWDWPWCMDVGWRLDWSWSSVGFAVGLTVGVARGVCRRVGLAACVRGGSVGAGGL